MKEVVEKERGESLREKSFSYVWSCQVVFTIFNLFTTRLFIIVT